MTYEETVEYLYSLLPSFQEKGGAALNYKLDKISSLLEVIGDPQKKFKSIHVGGTNGKGTTSHLLAAALSESGYRVGLYTSPHLKAFTERIKVSQNEIDQQFVVDFVERFQGELERFRPSFFEMTVLLAFYYFAEKKVEIAIVEVGLGGRFDATNIINPICSVITNISLDHQEFLGHDIKAIAFEKAGIIKGNVPVVIGEYHDESAAVFKKQAAIQNSKLVKAYEVNLPEKYFDNDDVDYVLLNKRTAYAVIEELSDQVSFEGDRLNYAFKNYASIWGLKGRWQQLGEFPLVYCDTGHNVAAVELLMSRVNDFIGQVHIVWGMAKDKDVDAILGLLSKKANYYFCQSNNGRGLDVVELQHKALGFGLDGNAYESVQIAIEAARKKAGKADFVLIGGSTFVVAEIEEI